MPDIINHAREHLHHVRQNDRGGRTYKPETMTQTTLLLDPLSQGTTDAADATHTATAGDATTTRIGSGTGSIDDGSDGGSSSGGGGGGGAVEVSEDGEHAAFLYPSGDLTFNYLDAVEVSYDSIWSSADLAVMCNTNPQDDLFVLAAFPLIDGKGTYTIDPILAGMDIDNFPVECYLRLTDAEDSSDIVSGAAFQMVSTAGQPVTYGISTTATTGGSSPTGASGGTSTSNGSSGSASATNTGVAAASTAGSSELSPGAKAGLAIGIILAVVAILAAVFFVFRKRRQQMGEHLASETASTTGPVTAANEKQTGAAALAAAAAGGLQTPGLRGLGANRNSDDWRRFFGNGSLKSLRTVPSAGPSPLQQAS